MEISNFPHPYPIKDPASAEAAVRRSLLSLGLVDAHEAAGISLLTRGKYAECWRALTSTGDYFVKRYHHRLRSIGELPLPPEGLSRGWARAESSFFQIMSRFLPLITPTWIAHDADTDLLVTQFYPTDQHPTWESSLRSGKASVTFASSVGRILGMLHESSANRSDFASFFQNRELFMDRTIQPIMDHVNAIAPDVVPYLENQLTAFSLRDTVNQGSVGSLLHGSCRLKNIREAHGRPVFFSAASATYGEPALDFALMVADLLALSIDLDGQRRRGTLLLLRAMGEAYRTHVPLPLWQQVEARSISLVGGLTLAALAKNRNLEPHLVPSYWIDWLRWLATYDAAGEHGPIPEHLEQLTASFVEVSDWEASQSIRA